MSVRARCSEGMTIRNIFMAHRPLGVLKMYARTQEEAAMYTDTAEIVEALGYNPAFGMREWFGDIHVDDVLAVAELLDLRQRGMRGGWVAPSEEACFLFSEQVDAFAMELDIPPLVEQVPLAPSVYVMPSFKSFGVAELYILEKIQQFFMMYCMEGRPEAREIRVMLNDPKDEWHLNLYNPENSYRQMTLTRVPVHYRYGAHHELRFELGRLIQDAVRVYGLSSEFFAGGLSVRQLHWEGMRFIESLWGMVEERT
jgi:hypothetical protein